MKYFINSVMDRSVRIFGRGNKRSGGPAGKTRIVLITQWYSPEPVSVPILTAKELEDAGFKVEVLTGIPNLPDGVVHAPYKAWKIYNEIVEGIPVRRAPLYPNHSSSAVKRMLNYLSWAFSATFVGWSNLINSDVNVVHCTPATAAIPALFARWLTGTPYVVIIQDLWPDTVSASGFVRNRIANKIISDILDIAVNILYRNAAQIAVISPGMGNTLLNRGFRSDRLTSIFNSVDEGVFQPQEIDPHVRARYKISDDAFFLVYAGNQGSAQNLKPLLQAVASLEKERVEILMVGWGVERKELEKLALESGSGNIQFLDRVSPTEVRVIQSAANLSVVSLKDDPLFRITIPSKLQTLLASGRAILGVVSGDPGRIIRESKSGFVAEPGNVESIRHAIKEAQSLSSQALEEMGNSGREYYLSYMSSSQRSDALRRLVEKARDTSPSK